MLLSSIPKLKVTYVPLLQCYRILCLSIYLPLPKSFMFSHVFMLYLASLHFNLKGLPLVFLVKQSLVAINSLSFCFFRSFYFSFIFEGQFCQIQFSWLAFSFFSVSTLNTASHSLPACNVTPKMPTEDLMGAPLYETTRFFLAAFKILSLPLPFDSFVIMCLGLGLFELLKF